jgi:hypothetical protein
MFTLDLRLPPMALSAGVRSSASCVSKTNRGERRGSSEAMFNITSGYTRSRVSVPYTWRASESTRSHIASWCTSPSARLPPVLPISVVSVAPSIALDTTAHTS